MHEKMKRFHYFFIMAMVSITNAHGQELLMEAENAILTGVTVANSAAEYSGTGYITGFEDDNDQIQFDFSAEAGIYSVIIGYRSPNGKKGYDLSVNEINGTGMFPGPNDQFTEIEAGKYRLKEGSNKNTIIIGKGWGWFDIDYVRIEPTTVELPSKPSSVLIDEDSTPETKALFRYLLTIYSQKVLSGQQSLEEITYIKSVTGKSPALGSFDLIDYSPSRIEYGANPGNSAENWIAWQKEGNGIVSLCWHWNAPAELLNTPDHEWWSGFYTHATTFDLEASLADETSENYQLLLRDLDAIAVQLKKFSDEDIPILWRPLHEASGGWFWWGAKGAGPYQELWQLMYNRFTTYHNLHNLIWVSTHGDNSWYTGDDYVDVVGLDIYTDPSSNMSGEWELAQTEFNSRKLVALTETGTLPNPDNVRDFCTWWSWFSIWEGDFITNIDSSYLISVYHDEDIITLDELPHWQNTTSLKDIGMNSPSPEIRVFPNPSGKSTNISFTLSEPSDARISVYNTSGMEITSMLYKAMGEGTYTSSFSCDSLTPGIYLVRMETGNDMVCTELIINQTL